MSPDINRPERRSDLSPQCRIDVNVWSLTSFSPLRLPAFLQAYLIRYS